MSKSSCCLPAVGGILTFLVVARERLQQQHWDSSELGCYWLWYVLGELAESRDVSNGGADRGYGHYASREPAEAAYVLRRVPQEDRNSILPHPDVGLIAAVANTSVDPAMLHAGREILTRLVRERSIIFPLRRALTPPTERRLPCRYCRLDRPGGTGVREDHGGPERRDRTFRELRRRGLAGELPPTAACPQRRCRTQADLAPR